MALDEGEVLELIRCKLRLEIETGGYMGKALDGKSPLWIDEPGRIQVTLKLDGDVISRDTAHLDMSQFFRRP